ncbi:hypothetical protein P4C99_07915 [Pontiellaceae bacterium B1224]|nr:hypothetical protein [Pontiellaceae bacterium B1224]
MLKEIDGLGDGEEILLGLTYTEDDITAAVKTESGFSAFGFDIGPSGEGGTAEYTCTMNYSFEITKFEITGLTLEKSDDEDEFKIEDVKVCLKEGKITEMSCAHGELEYVGFKFQMDGLTYDGTVKTLTINNAQLEVKDDCFQVTDFVMKSDGSIQSITLDVEFDDDPVYASITAALKDGDQGFCFEASLTVKIKDDGLEGSVVIGSDGDGDSRFSYGYLELKVYADVQIGTTPLKFTQVGAEVGYNYDVTGALPDNDCDIVLGGTIGIANSSDAFELVNTILFTIGSDSFVELMGDISIPRNNALLMGELYANYTFGEGQVEGTLSSDLK